MLFLILILMILQIGAESFSLIFVEIKDRENHIMDQFVQIIRAESFTELMIGGITVKVIPSIN